MIDKPCSTTDKVSASGLEKYNFYCGQGMQKNWVDNNVAMMEHMGNNFGQRVKVSMLDGKMIFTEVDNKSIPKLKTEADKKIHADGLRCQAMELHEQTKDDYTKFSRLIGKDLSSAHSMLCSLCHIGLRNRLEAEADCWEMANVHKYDVMPLYSLIKRNEMVPPQY